MTLPHQTTQQQSQHFLLKWNNHRSNMVNVFESLLAAENLVDVTIAVEGKFLKAHKVVLSACSPYFQAMFVNHSPSDKYPILLFHDIKFAHLKTLLDFMYRGEISIDEKDLGDVLKVAEALSIRGLSSFESDEEESDSPKGDNTNRSSSPQPSSMDSSGGMKGDGNSQDIPEEAPSSRSSSSGRGRHKSPKSGHKLRSNPPVSERLASASPSSVLGKRHHLSPSEKREKVTKEEGQGQGSHSAPEVVVKKKRGRKKVIGVGVGTSTASPVPSPTPKLSTRINSASATFTGTRGSSSSIAQRHGQGVRRRLPRRYPGIPTRLKRVKLAKGTEGSGSLVGSDSTGNGHQQGGSGSGNGTGQYAEMDDALIQQMLEDEDCEPLSEMSVRGLDLFKYASVEDNVFRCIECEKLRIPKTFKNKYSFQRHAFLYHEGNMRKVFPCPVCSREFSRPDKMKNHMKSVHEGVKDTKENGSNAEVKGEHLEEDGNSCDS